jgi:hypothetical protein
MLGRLRMSIDDTITSYNRLMSKVFSEPKVTITGRTEAFKATVLEEELKGIVKRVTGNESDKMIEQDSNNVRCKV